jgi:hypothetical protein
VSETEARREIESLRQRNEQLERRAVEAEQAIAAFAYGEVDAVTLETSATPVLLHVAQDSLRRNEQLLRAIFDGALDAMLLRSCAGVATKCWRPRTAARRFWSRRSVLPRFTFCSATSCCHE